MSKKFSLTREQTEAIADIIQLWRNVETVDLTNDTPNGLRVDVRIGGKLPQTQTYRMGTDGDYIYEDVTYGRSN